MLDPIYTPNDLNLLRANCKVYIHGHSAGGTNPSLVEAMNLNLPIIAYDVPYNRSTTENKALYFDGTEQLQELITSIDKFNLKQISEDMKEIAQRRYRWKVIVSKYEELYHL